MTSKFNQCKSVLTMGKYVLSENKWLRYKTISAVSFNGTELNHSACLFNFFLIEVNGLHRRFLSSMITNEWYTNKVSFIYVKALVILVVASRNATLM